MRIELADLTTMSDPDFLAQRRRVIDQLWQAGQGSAEHAELATATAALNAEFDRRARAAWSASPGSAGAGGEPSSHDDNRETESMDDNLRKKLLAIEVLLEEPGEISDGLESELYLLRDTLQAQALS